MSFFINKLVNIVDTIKDVYHQNIVMPIIRFISDTAELYKQRTIRQAHNARDLLLRGCVITFIISLLVWLSIVMYIAFYYAYVPYVTHTRPVHLQFDTCEKKECDSHSHSGRTGICSFPSAHVQLTNRNQLLMIGQPYKVTLSLEMPESPTNKNLGMFMVCAQFRTKSGELVQNSCRSAMLTYRSQLLQNIQTIMFIPAFLLGTSLQKQNINVEFFSDYEDEQERPVTDVYIEIQSHSIELYSATLQISAHFSGLRYLMFHWPILSASLGVTCNLFVIAIVCVISWYQLINSDEYINYTRLRQSKQGKSDFNGEPFEDSSTDNSLSSENLDEMHSPSKMKERGFVEDLDMDLTNL